MAIRIEPGRVVTLAYRLTDGEGREIEDRTPENPFEYIQGQGQILPAIEKVVDGKTPGFAAELQISAREGYGEYNPTLVAEIPVSRFPPDKEIAVGMKFNTTGPNGQAMIVRVIDVDEHNVTVDGNHPLAGMELVFELRVLDVRDANQDESDSGEVTPEKARGSKGHLH